MADTHPVSARRNPLDRLVRQPPPGLDHPVRIRFSADESAITYLFGPGRSNVRSLWWHDLATGARHELAQAPRAATRRTGLRREDELVRQRRRQSGLGLTDYRASSDADLLVSVAAGRCLVSRDGSAARALPGWEAVQDAVPSPDGTRLALVRGGDLWVVGPNGGGIRLTSDAEPGRFNGLPEYVAAEELDRFDGCWWSTDSRALAWASVDERHIPEIAIEHHASPDRRVTSSDRYRYPFAGAPNAHVTLRVRSVDDAAAPQDVDLGIGDGYLARMVAHPHGGWLAAVLPRDQRNLHWWRVTQAGGASELWVERADPWINLDDATRVLADGRILRATEAAGTRHLELRRPDGVLERRLTAGPWAVTEMVHVDEPRGAVLFMATADGVTQRHAYTVPLDTARPVERPERLTAEAGWHALVASRSGSRWADTWSTRARAPEVVIRDRDGRAGSVVHTASATATRLHLVVPELRTLHAPRMARRAAGCHLHAARPRRRTAPRRGVGLRRSARPVGP